MWISIVLGGLALALLGGCGGGGGDTTASQGPALTKAAFVKQADAICERSVARLEAEYATYKKENPMKEGLPSQSQQTEVAETIIIPNLQSRAGELGELGPPKGAEARVAAMIEALEDLIAKGENEPLGVLSRNAWERVSSAATQIGLKSCTEAI
jgi:hypothetical protein